MEYYLRQLYGKKFDVETEIEPRMWKEVLRIINEATVEGLSQSKATPTLEENFYTQLRQSNEVFAAFKVHSMGNVMAKMLVGDDGKLKPFRQWKEDVKGVSSHYCGRWLQTEYATAVARAHAAADWMEFEKNKDIFPNLRWMPTTSPNPEKTHEVFWKMKLTRPIGDKFWDEHMPGDHWNCKCSLEQTDDPATTLPTDEEMKRDEPQDGLKGNPAKTGQLFDKSHPYFPKNCKECGFNKRKGVVNFLGDFFNNGGVKCDGCVYFSDVIEHIKKDFCQYKDVEPPKIDSYISLHNGNVLASPYHGKDEWEHNENIAKFLTEKLNKKIYMLPRLNSNTLAEIELRKKFLPSNVAEKKNPDFYIGGRTFDAKSLYDLKRRTDSENYQHAIQNKIKKAKDQAENIILDIPDFVPQKDIKGAIHGFLKVSHKKRTILVRYKNKLYIYKKRET